MRHLRIMLFAVIIIAVSACLGPREQSAGEPQPPDPFPVELSSRLSVFEVAVQEQTAVLKLQMTVNRNTELHSQVVAAYKLSKFEDGSLQSSDNKTVYNGNPDLYVKQAFSEDVRLSGYGTYRLDLEAEYGPWGKNEWYIIEFDDDGISVAQD